MNAICAVLTCTSIGGVLAAESLAFDLTGIASYDSLGSPNNHVINFDVCIGGTVTGLSWDNIVGDGLGGTSWGNEMAIAVADNGHPMISLGVFPTEASNSAGGTWGPASGGSSTNLVDLGYEWVSATGHTSFEFFETYDDAEGVADAYYQSGTVTIHWIPASTPVPGIGGLAALMGVGLLGRRRR